MNLEEIEGIYNSLGVVNVTYKGNPVWIEDIARQSEIAHIRDLKTDELKIVPISELIQN